MKRLPCLAAIVDFDRTLLRTDKTISGYTVHSYGGLDVVNGGVAEDFCSLLTGSGWRGRFLIRAVDDRFVPHASVNSSLARLGLDADGMYDTIKTNLSAAGGKDESN